MSSSSKQNETPAGGAGNRYSGTVAVWFTSHYQVDSRDWDNIEEFGGPHHPLSGYYKSDDPAILEQQLRWIRRAGIDAIVYDVFSTGKWDLTDLPKDRTLPQLLEALENQQDESRKLKLIIWLEKYLGFPTVAQYEFALEYVRKNLVDKDYYFWYNDKPLVVAFPSWDNEALSEVKRRTQDIEMRPIGAYDSDFWDYVAFYPQKLKKGWICASPGFDAYLEDAYVAKHIRKDSPLDLEAVRAKAPRADREGGAFYERQLTRAKDADPDIIFVSGWNDWQYANQIEPAVEYEFLYVDMTARVLGRQDETAPYR